MKTRLFTEEFKKKQLLLSIGRGSVDVVAEELGIRLDLSSKWHNNPWNCNFKVETFFKLLTLI